VGRRRPRWSEAAPAGEPVRHREGRTGSPAAVVREPARRSPAGANGEVLGVQVIRPSLEEVGLPGGHARWPCPGSRVAHLLRGMLATGVMLSSFRSLAISIAVERDEGGLERLRGTPVPATSYFLRKTGQVLVTSLVQTAILLVVAATPFDAALPTSATAWATSARVFVLGTATGCLCGAGFSTVPRSGRSVSAVVTPVGLVLQFVSGVLFQFDQLPRWTKQLARAAGRSVRGRPAARGSGGSADAGPRGRRPPGEGCRARRSSRDRARGRRDGPADARARWSHRNRAVPGRESP